MTKLEQLKEELETNDILFDYAGKMYVICPWGSERYLAGPGGPSDGQEFVGFDNLANGWLIEGKPLKDIIDKIILL